MQFSIPPCTKDCPKRSPVCHFKDNCPEHDAWKSAENVKNAALDKSKAVTAGLVENTTASFIKHVVKNSGRRPKGQKVW